MAFQILSLSGGGYLGLYTVAILAGLEEITGEPLARKFDLIAGTSVGGILAIGLAAEIPAKIMKEAFLTSGSAVFSANPPAEGYYQQAKSLLKNAKRAKYASAPLQALVDKMIGSNTRIGDLKHRVMIPAVNLFKGMPQVFKTSHHPTFVRDWRMKAIDVALATSAAPTYFPIHKIGGELFADGGLYANAPDHLALHEACRFLEEKIEEVSMVSIGTTPTSFSFSNSIGQNLGWLDWMVGQKLSTAMIASQQINVDYMLRHILQERFLRIDRAQSCEQEKSLALDVASKAAKADLLALAEASLREHLGRPTLPAMLRHSAKEPKFFNR